MAITKYKKAFDHLLKKLQGVSQHFIKKFKGGAFDEPQNDEEVDQKPDKEKPVEKPDKEKPVKKADAEKPVEKPADEAVAEKPADEMPAEKPAEEAPAPDARALNFERELLAERGTGNTASAHFY